MTPLEAARRLEQALTRHDHEVSVRTVLHDESEAVTTVRLGNLSMVLRTDYYSRVIDTPEELDSYVERVVEHLRKELRK